MAFYDMKIIKYIILILILTFNYKINCQIPGRMNLYDHSFAVGFVESSPDKFYSNPAKLRFSEAGNIGMSISPSVFGLKELNSGNIFYSGKLNDKFLYGASLYGMGGELYNEFSGSLDMAYLLDDRFTFGISAEMSRLFVKDFNSHYNLLLTAGSIINISENIAGGVAVNNLLRQSYGNIEKAIYQQALIGLAVKSRLDFIFEISGVINLNNSSGVIFGMRRNILDIADIRMSVGTQPKSYEIGMKFDIIDRFLFNFNFFYDTNLGYNRRVFVYGNL